MPSLRDLSNQLLLDAMDVAQPSFVTNEEWDACDSCEQRQMAEHYGSHARIMCELRIVIVAMCR